MSVQSQFIDRAVAWLDEEEKKVAPPDRLDCFLRVVELSASHLADISSGASLQDPSGPCDFKWDVYFNLVVAMDRVNSELLSQKPPEKWLQTWTLLQTVVIRMKDWEGDRGLGAAIARAVFVSATILRETNTLANSPIQRDLHRGYEICAVMLPTPIDPKSPPDERSNGIFQNLNWALVAMRSSTFKPLWKGWRFYHDVVLYFLWMALAASVVANLAFWIGSRIDAERFFIHGLTAASILLVIPCHWLFLKRQDLYKMRLGKWNIFKRLPKLYQRLCWICLAYGLTTIAASLAPFTFGMALETQRLMGALGFVLSCHCVMLLIIQWDRLLYTNRI